ncbi:T9SS type A sorting domain-containing protein [Spirosoma soli]|uniref:T9SS type A sorting domain-containing protein n=1 Tax=Spirosoma soli TaxID=1770529 RepID=A0ABW5MAV2_9BACT
MKTTFTASVAQSARWTVCLSLFLLRCPLHSLTRIRQSQLALISPRTWHGRWALALLWLLGLAWSTNAIAQVYTGSTVAGGSKGNGENQLDTVQAVFVDRAGFIYVADQVNNRIMKFPPNSSSGTAGTVVAGGNDYGSEFNQLAYPTGVFVDTLGAIYVADRDNHRIMKFPSNSSKNTAGTIVAGYNGQGPGLNQLDTPSGVFVDKFGAIYVADLNNHRIMKFPSGSSRATSGIIVAGFTKSPGTGQVYLHYPTSVFVDDSKAVYVADSYNNRIIKFPPGSVTGTPGTLVAGSDKGEFGPDTLKLNSPSGVFVDKAGAVYVADYFNHRIQKWAAGGARTVAGITLKPGNGANQLRHPTGVFVDEAGAVYVADAENYRIQKFLPASVPPIPVEVPPTPLTPAIPVAHVGITVAGVTSQPGNGASLLHGPRGVFVDGAKTVFVADQVNNRIQKFPPGSSSGTPGTTVAGGNGYGSAANQLGYPTGVAVDNAGLVYVADSANHRIMKWGLGASEGIPVAGGNGQGRDVRQLDSPGGVFVNGDGAIYVADTYNHRIQKYTPTTNNGILVETVAGNGSQGSGPTQLDHPGGVFVDESGAIYVADTRNYRIQKFPPGSSGVISGTTVAGGSKGSGPNELDYPSSVFVDGAGAIYVADTRNHRIQKWALGPTSGTTVAGGQGRGPGANQLDYPTGIAVDRDGAVYVADYGNERIQKFSPVHTGSGGLLGGAAPSALRLVAPLYDCQSGAFSFQSQGGDGSPIEYMAAGITAWTTNPNQFVDKETRTAADAQPITLLARQNGQTVRYLWDIRAVCPVGDPSQLRLLMPQYDCQSGAFVFQTQGGDGSPVEYMAAGITAWTTNPNQFVDQGLRQAADAQPITLWARQKGKQVRYVWDLRAMCPVSPGLGSARARVGVGGLEKEALWRATVSPNPVGAEFGVTLEGAQQASVRLLLTDLRGQVVVDKQVVVEQATHQERLELGSAPVGMYLLRVSTAGQTKTLKVIKGH